MTLKSLLLGAAGAASLCSAAPVLAHDASSACLDLDCQKIAIFPVVAVEAGGGDATVAKRFGTWGFDAAGMDTSVKPGDSFFQYANGKAVAAMTIPSDKSRYGAFNMLSDLSEARVHKLVEGYGRPTEVKSDRGKIAAIFASFMDDKKIEALDSKPLAADLARVRAIKTRSEVARMMGKAQGGVGATLFAGYVDLDRKNPDINAFYITQAGLGLPDRDYYLKPAFAAKKAKYEAYIAGQLERAGWPDPQGAAKRVVAFETQIAEAHWSRIESRDADKTYNAMSLAELSNQAPQFPWRTWIDAAGAGKAKGVIVRQPTAFAKAAKVFAETPVQTLRDWEAFHIVDEMAPVMSSRFAAAHFDFHGHELAGTPQDRPRWKRGLAQAENAMGEAIGRDFVAAYFPASSKAKMEALVGDLRAALKARIEKLDWMSDATKAKALEKLSKFGVKIGYPSKWRDYSGLVVKDGDAYGNMQRSDAFEWAYNLSKLGKKKDPAEWGMTPQTVNAYYNPTRNEIVFPAAILQPPFFDPDADPAVNYGGIGGVIGHEMTHGFDDQGRKSDGDGRLTDWWTAQDAAKFDAKAKAYGEQYDTYEPVPGAHVQGKLTMGENIADLGGVNLGLDAYHASLHGQPAPTIDGFTGDQRVYLGWAQVWREKARDDYRRLQVTVDPHSPGDFRVIGPLRNVDAWYKAFDVTDGKYYLKPEDRVRIW